MPRDNVTRYALPYAPYTPPQSNKKRSSNNPDYMAGIAAAVNFLQDSKTKTKGPTFTTTGTQTKRKGGGRKGKLRSGVLGGKKAGGGKKAVKRTSGKRHNILSQGVYMTTERSVVQTSDDNVFIGHVSAPVLQTTQIVAMAFTKAIFKGLGCQVRDMNDIVEAVVAADQLVIEYRADREPLTGVSSQIFTPNGQTYAQLADAIATFMQGRTEQSEWVAVYFYPNPGTSRLPFRKWDLLHTKIHINSKSTLKFQNRTVNETGDEDTNDVDNVPLSGRSYHGKGTGTEWNNGTNPRKPFFADRYGLINKDGNIEGLREPPFGQLFPRVKKQGKIAVDPGVIRTSGLRTVIDIGFNRFQRVNDVNTYAATYPAGILGEFEFFSLEKVIGGLSEQKIQVAAEHNLIIGCIVSLGKPRYTTTVFAKTLATDDVIL